MNPEFIIEAERDDAVLPKPQEGAPTVSKPTATDIAKAFRERKESGRAKKALAKAKQNTRPTKLPKTAKVLKAKAEAKKAEPKKKESGSTGSGKGGQATCSICGKPLSRGSSMSQGMGDICAHQKVALKGMSMEDHYEKVTTNNLPDGYILLKDAIAAAQKKGTSGYRFLQGIGGNRLIHKPVNSYFKTVFYKGARYVNGESLKHLKDLEKV